MAWCPKCKTEYRDGITTCAECDSQLVNLPAGKEPLISGEKVYIERIAAFLKYNEIEYQLEDAEDGLAIYTEKKFEKEAKKIISVFLQQEEIEKAKKELQKELDAQEESEDAELPETEEDNMEDELEDELEEVTEEVLNDSNSMYRNEVFQKKSEKAKDFKGSAYILLIVGMLGLVALVLVHFGIIPFEFGNPILMNIVMGALFIAFIILAIQSFTSAKRYESDAVKEEETIQKIKDWCEQNLNGKSIDEQAHQETDSDEEEILYFKRIEIMKKKIETVFFNVDEALMEHILEDCYKKLFEDNNDH